MTQLEQAAVVDLLDGFKKSLEDGITAEIAKQSGPFTAIEKSVWTDLQPIVDKAIEGYIASKFPPIPAV